MKKKIIQIFMTFVLIIQTILPSFSFAESQPAVCSAPSKEMSLYFDFQTDALTILMGDSIKTQSIESVSEKPWLFSQKVLTLGNNTSMISNLVKQFRSNARSLMSAGITTTVLLMLTASQVIESGIESIFGILWQDRPIVRDYKKMLEIDQRIMNVAYYLSDKYVLTNKLESGKITEEWSKLLTKYENAGLLEINNKNPGSNLSLASLLGDLSEMNAAMKGFLSFSSSTVLKDYRGCFGSEDVDEDGNYSCEYSYSYIFSDSAVKNLKNDYSNIRYFGKCNTAFRDFGQSISRSVNNNIDEVGEAMENVKASMCRLQQAFNRKSTTCEKYQEEKSGDGRCSLTPYETALLRSYHGGNWKCKKGLITVKVEGADGLIEEIQGSKDDFISNNSILSMVKNLNDHINTISTHMKFQKESSMYKVCKIQSNNKALSELCWYNRYGNDSYYNENYSTTLNEEILETFQDIESQHELSRVKSVTVDLSEQLVSMGALIQSVEDISKNSLGNEKNGAYQWINNVVNYQCSN